MARPPGESPFRAPIMRSESLPPPGTDDGTFERELLGFCVTALLDRRAQLVANETRTWWAGRLAMSKSHMSKMVETPSAGFIDRFDLALTEMASISPVHPNAATGRRLSPLLSDFYADLRPAERRDASRTVLKWFARYQPSISPQLRDVLFRSEVALERCSMLERSGAAEYDDLVRQSIRELLTVVSGPYGASLIAHQQCAEIGLRVPTAFFDALEETLERSPLGFRVLRTLDRFVQLWRAPGADPNLPRKQAVDLRLAPLLRRLARAAENLPFLDPYPGCEWAIALARDCLQIETVDDHVDRGRERREDAGDYAYHWLQGKFADEAGSDRTRLYAAWVLVGHPSREKRSAARTALIADSTSAYLTRWARLLEQIQAAPRPTGTWNPHADALIRHEFSAELSSVHEAVSAQTEGEHYRGIREALESVIFSALVTPDGRLRRALIEAIVNAGLVGPAASALDALLGIDPDPSIGFEDPSLRETAIFLLGRLRQPSRERVRFLARIAANDPDPSVVHAAVWCLGDIWRSDQPAGEVVSALRTQALDSARPGGTRVAAAHVLAIIAHQEVHASPRTTVALEALAKIERAIDETTRNGHPLPTVSKVVRSVAGWGKSFDPSQELDPSKHLTMSGLLEGNITDQDNLGQERQAVGA